MAKETPVCQLRCVNSPDDEPDDPWYAKLFLFVFVVLVGAAVCGGGFAWWSSYRIARRYNSARQDSMEAIKTRFWIGAGAGAVLTAGWLAANWRKNP